MSKKLIIILIFLFVFIGYSQTSNDDYIIINKELIKYKKITSDSLFLVEKGANKQVLFLFKKQLETDFLNTQEYSRQLILNRILKDSLSTIKRDSIIDELFNIENFEYVKEQISEKFKWNFDMLDVDVFKTNSIKPEIITNDSWLLKRKKLYLSKPVYSIDGKFALVYFHFRRTNGYKIYIKNDEDWTFYKLINPMIE